MTRMQVILVAAVWSIAHSTAATADDGSFYGLLRMRDLSPFGFLRLDMRPAPAVSIEPLLDAASTIAMPMSSMQMFGVVLSQPLRDSTAGARENASSRSRALVRCPLRQSATVSDCLPLRGCRQR